MSTAFALFVFFFFFLHCLTAVTVAQQQSFIHNIRAGKEEVTVDCNLFSIRSPNFGVLVQNDAGNLTSYSAPPPRTYLGTVRGRPGAMVAALVKPNGSFFCRISFENGIEWSSTGGVASVRGNTNWKPQWPTSAVPSTSSSSVIFVAEVGVDASYKEYVAAAANVNDTINIVEFSILAANMPFLRDASIFHKLGKLVIRASQSKDPYKSSMGKTGVLLNTVRSQWNGVISSEVGKTHNLALVVQPGAGGGLAFVATVATKNAYSSNGANKNGDFSVLWRHEAGHNWASKHYEGGVPEGPTIMSGNALSRFSSSELAKILRYKTRAPQLAVANLSIPRPPRANMDTVIIQNTHPLRLSTLLANDMDADIQSLSIVEVQNTSALNGIAQVASGNQIIYTPSPAAALSIDYFRYTIQNSLGRSSTAYVITRPDSLVAWWKMNKKNLLTVQDFSGNGIDGTITGSTTWDQSGNGLVFGGSGKVSFGTRPSLRGTTSFSLSVWVKVVSSSTMVIIQQRSQSTNTTNGYNGEYQLSLVSGKPHLMLFGDSNCQFQFTASTAVNDDQWHHLVATRDFSDGRIYVDGELSASASGEVRNLDGTIPVFMGWDARANNSFLTGSVRDARIYNRPLSSQEVSHLTTSGQALVDEGVLLNYI